ncbi:hypothetical protein C8P63_101269 [Melghirimyces profundicolus]|uniref:Uncharacterized protein n=1 Tax=Melghirimyces profundicolus TaxID=1242148 RepID=A0A2T6C9N7_9BACL|nr:hypothetical protein [Melghirimyces profundicolus]PTX65045.1 hypothetical protein C8P63_101269 [Melghirimyces profundicolus]
MEKEDSIIDFSRRRTRWQKEQFRAFHRLIRQLFRYVESETNLREKVRARHLFSSLTGVLPPGRKERKDEWFQIWYALDYLNIQGARHLDRYMEKYRSRLSDKDLQLMAALLASYFSVYRLEESDRRMRVVREAFRKGEKGDKVLGAGSSPSASGLYFLRPVKVGVQYTPLGPAVPVTPVQKEWMEEWLESVYRQEKEQRGQPSPLPWRMFMQQWGIGLIRWSDTKNS